MRGEEPLALLAPKSRFALASLSPLFAQNMQKVTPLLQARLVLEKEISQWEVSDFLEIDFLHDQL